MEVSGTDADPVFMKECITTIRDIYPEYHLIICNDKDHNMIRQEDAPYKHILHWNKCCSIVRASGS